MEIRHTAPIGVFDSGLGGLTAVRELRRILPGEDIVYFGDTGRVPYGTKGREVIIGYAKQDIALLLAKGVKAVVAACGTVSSTLPDAEIAALPVGYTSVVSPTVAAALAATRSGRIGIVGTEATIASHSYRKEIARLAPSVQTFENACPLFVPLVENGHFAPGDALVELTAAEYLAPLKAAGVDTLILGCTHYPLLAEALGLFMGEGVTLIDSGRETALALKAQLGAAGLLNPRNAGGTAEYYVTDDPARFGKLATLFLGGDIGGSVARIPNIETYSLPRILRGIQPLREG